MMVIHQHFVRCEMVAHCTPGVVRPTNKIPRTTNKLGDRRRAEISRGARMAQQKILPQVDMTAIKPSFGLQAPFIVCPSAYSPRANTYSGLHKLKYPAELHNKE